MTPLRAKYIRDLTIRGRAQRTQRAYTRYVSELARYYQRSPELISYEELTQLALPFDQGAPTVGFQRQRCRQCGAFSLWQELNPASQGCCRSNTPLANPSSPQSPPKSLTVVFPYIEPRQG